jgi:[acyl-carrier-protein] S-malonyltransferase
MSSQEQTAYVFPGQGSQWVGMARDICASSPLARQVFDEADSSLGFSLSRLCFEGPELVLRQTINAQPAILTVSIAYLAASPELTGKSSPPAFLAGHSLGEYTALVAAQVLPFKDALYLARERGRLMHEAGEKNPGGMLAIIGLDEAVVDDICCSAHIQIANVNCPGQIVVTGPTHLLGQAAELARAKGAHRVIPLQVSGAFHSRLMEPAAEGMSHATSTFTFRDPTIPIVANTTARPIANAQAIRAELLSQLLNCVQWQRSVEYMIKEGVNTFIEIGPGQVLSGLIKRVSKNVNALSIERNSQKNGKG